MKHFFCGVVIGVLVCVCILQLLIITAPQANVDDVKMHKEIPQSTIPFHNPRKTT